MSSLPPIPFPPPSSHQGPTSNNNLFTNNNNNNSSISAPAASTNNLNNNNNNNIHSSSSGFEDSGFGGSIDGSGGGGGGSLGLISSGVSIGGSYSDFGDPNNVCTLSSSTSSRWFFSKEQLANTPSRRAGIDPDKELSLRQQAASFIQDIGQRLQVNQLCINTAIVYMHRFYMYHSFTQFQKNAISTAAIFLAAKVEEQPRKLEYVIKIAHYCLYRDTQPQVDVKSEYYAAQSSELVSNENILLQTLGFDVSVDHPHIHVVKCCQLVRAPKDLAQTSYFMATNSLHLTTMCLQYMPNVVACVCIHLACKWSSWEIPRSKEGREWYYYVCDTMTPHRLEQLTGEFLNIFNKSPSRLKKKILSIRAAGAAAEGNIGNAGSSSLSAANKSVPQAKPGVGVPLHHSKQGLLPPPGHPLSKHGSVKPLVLPVPPSSSSTSLNQQPHHHQQHQQHSSSYHQSTKDGSNHHPNIKPHPAYPHNTANGSHHSHYPSTNRPHPSTHQSSGQSRSSLGPSYPHLGQNSANSSQVTGSQSNHHYSLSSSTRPGLPAPGHPMSKHATKPQFPFPVSQMHPPPLPHPPPPSAYSLPPLINSSASVHLLKDGAQPKEKRRKTTKY